MREAGIRIFLFILAAGGFSGCAMSTPVLRHETGEALGSGRFRISTRYEATRAFATVSEEMLPAGVAEQPNSAFRGSLLGVQAAAGVLSNLDLQLAGYIIPSGGGWRIGSKYQINRQGRFATSVMAGFGALSSGGEASYLTQAQPVEIQQTLSSKTFDIAFPVSYRFLPTVAAYGGPILVHTAVDGSFGSGTVVNTTQTDFGTNLGFRFNFGRYEADLECAVMRAYDPFTDGYRLIPFLGVGAAITF